MKFYFAALLLLCLLFCACTNVLREQIEAEKAAVVPNDLFVLAQGRVNPREKEAGVWIHYEAIREAMAQDRLGEVPKLAQRFEGFLKTHPAISPESVRVMEESVSEPELRIRFGELSRVVIALYRKSPSGDFQLYRCPMAKRYSDWMQPKSLEIANPYMGKRMLACGFPIEIEQVR